jgi:hypothetical protein
MTPLGFWSDCRRGRDFGVLCRRRLEPSIEVIWILLHREKEGVDPILIPKANPS